METTQKLRKGYDSPLEVAKRYFQLIGLLNNIHLTKRNVELLAFTAVRGSISVGGAREEFVRLFHSSLATANNMIAELQEKGLLVKINGRIMVHPKLQLDFTHAISLTLNLFVHDADRQA